MTETLSVSLSGPAISMLIYENLKSPLGQEGFLLGEILENKTRRITDHDQRQENVSRVIQITSSVPCPHVNYFYGGTGQVDVAKLKNFLQNLFPKVVAWYKFPSSTDLLLSFRERLVHCQLSSLFQVPLDHFACCLLNTEAASENGSTHSFTHNFVRLHNDGYEWIPSKTVSFNRLENPNKQSGNSSKSVLRIVEGLKVKLHKNKGPSDAVRIHEALREKIGRVKDELVKVEEKSFVLEERCRGKLEGSNKITEQFSNMNVVETAGEEINVAEPAKGKRVPRGRAKGIAKDEKSNVTESLSSFEK